jgi:UDP-N-acetylmuramoyl-tripeptide--D-alanyl-D-alanine ligase
MRITSADLAQAVGGTVHGPEVVAHGVSFDSRAVHSGQLFVAIVGDLDGHEFVSDAFDSGAALALVQRGRSPQSASTVEVDDTLAALNAYALHRRRLMPKVGGRVVGITGSAGKTSTKDFLLSALRSDYPLAHGAYKSFNNDIGVPVTILNASDECEALVLEMGMRGEGEIARLCSVAEPHIALITVVGDAHSERVGGIEGVARAKSELVASIPADGVAVLNADDERVRAMASKCRGRVVLYGTSSDADVRMVIDSVDASGCCLITLYSGPSQGSLRVPVPGEHMAMNATGAVAAALACGVSLEKAALGVQSSVLTHQRMEWTTATSGARILNDSYNANSSSMEAALRTLATVPAQRRIAVLAPMAEIADPKAAHLRIADLCRSLDIELVPCETHLYGQPSNSLEEIIGALGDLDGDTAILVKGSRAFQMERVVSSLVGS